MTDDLYNRVENGFAATNGVKLHDTTLGNVLLW